MITNNEKSAEVLKAEEMLAQAKARLAEAKRKESAKKRKEENQHKYMMGGIVHKYFPECYQFDEQELNRIIASAIKSEQCQRIIEIVKKEGAEKRVNPFAKSESEVAKDEGIGRGENTLDLMQYFVGEKPVSVKATLGKLHLPEEIEVEDTVTAHIMYPDARGCFYVSNGYVTDAPPLIELECEKARVRIEEEMVTVFSGGESTVHSFAEQKRLGKSHWGMGHQTAIADFYECVECGRKYSIELTDIEDTIYLLLQIYGK